MENFEIGRFLHLKSEIEISNWTRPICDFGVEVQESSNFKILETAV